MFKITGQYKEGMNVLGLVMFSVILGATIGKMREKGKPIQDFLVSLSEAMMIITRWVIWWVGRSWKLMEVQMVISFLPCQALTYRSLLLDHRQDSRNGVARRRHRAVGKILHDSPVGSLHPRIRNDCRHLLHSGSEAAVRLRLQNVASAGHSFRYRFELRHDANHHQLSRQHGNRPARHTFRNSSWRNN